MRKLWRHVAYNLRGGGLRQVVHKVMARIQQWWSSEITFVVYHVSLVDYSRTPRLNLKAERLSFERQRQLAYFRATSFPEVVQAALSAGRICYGFFLDGDLANVAWVEFDRLELLAGWSVPFDSAVAISNCWTFEGFRGRGVYADTLIMLLDEARHRGIRNGLIAVDPENTASVKGIERAGFRPMFRATRRIRLGRQFESRRSLVPSLDL